MTLCLGAIVTALVASAFAQVGGDQFAADLRANGPPLARQTIMVPAGEMVVDYAADGNICRIQLPSTAPDKQRPVVMGIRAMNRGAMSSGVNSVSFVEYENVTVSEMFNTTGRTGVTVTFKTEKCQDSPSPK